MLTRIFLIILDRPSLILVDPRISNLVGLGGWNTGLWVTIGGLSMSTVWSHRGGVGGILMGTQGLNCKSNRIFFTLDPWGVHDHGWTNMSSLWGALWFSFILYTTHP